MGNLGIEINDEGNTFNMVSSPEELDVIWARMQGAEEDYI